MSLLYTEEQKELIALVREMAENEIKPCVKDADEKGECPRELFQWGFDMGLHMLEIPAEYGGAGLSYETTAMIFEELAKVDAGYAITFVTTFVALRNVILAGTKEQGALTLIDATSGAGALPVDISQTDAYYFSPQKAFGSDGGLWIAVLSPAAVERAYGIAKSVDLPGARRWIPPFLSLTSAIENSRKDQTLNTPAVATLIMLENQVRWLNDNGGLAWASARCARSASLLYQWAEKSDYASPFVADKNAHSNAVVTIDLDERISATQVVAALRENGIVDTNGYRKLGRNQLRIGVFPSVDPSDVDSLTRCIDYVVEHL